MRIIGIDPGYAIVGWGIVDYNGNQFRVVDYGAVTTAAHQPLELRLKAIYDELGDIIARHKPDAMAVEELFFNSNTTTAIAVGQARGVILLSGINNCLTVTGYTPLQVKQAVAGYGRADKTQVQQMTRAILHLNEIPKPDDTADALAIAICHAHSYRMGGLGR
ncbi:MAG: crossover junction endodeoxyribonuclease RuvC [Ruminococcaceae bacterium]|nr:crossover junction endodeoxyribonuclease RuvC [Oscillospiraceae bacterium]